MSGRGRRARGRRKEVVDDVRGENVPPPIIQPPAMFPPLEFKPVPLIINEEQNYMLALKQELRGTLRDSAFYIQPVSIKKDIERYSDKYQQKDSAGNNIKWDFSRFPKELHEIRIKKRRHSKQPNASKKRKKNVSQDDIKNKLEQLETNEKSETSEEEQEEEKDDDEEGDKDEEELYDEEEQEEGTDYIVNYFDNGEEYLDDDDNLDDGPIY